MLLLAAALGPMAPTIEGTLVLRLIIHMFFFLAGALWLVAAAMEGRLQLRRAGIGPWFALFAASVLVSVANAWYRHPALLTAFLWLSNMCAFVLLFNLCATRKKRHLVLAVICASTLVVALHGIRQHEIEMPEALQRFKTDQTDVLKSLNLPPDMAYDLRGRLESMRVFSTFIIPNSFAGFLALVLPAMAGLLLDRVFNLAPSERRIPIAITALFLAPVFISFLMTGSKGGLAALFIGTLVFIVWAFRAFLWHHRIRVLSGIMLVLLLIVMAQMSGVLPPLRDYAGSLLVRAGYWRAALIVCEKHPLTGVGLDNFPDAYAIEKRPQDQEARRAHNDYLQLGAEIGLIGLALYLSAWVAFLRRLRVRHREPILPPPEPPAPQMPLRLGLILLGVLVFILEATCSGLFRSQESDMPWLWPVELCVAWIAFVLMTLPRKGDFGPDRHAYATVGVACGLIAFLAHSLLDFDHYVAGIYQTAWVFMGVLLAGRLSEEPVTFRVDRALRPASRLALIALPSAAALLLMYLYVLPLSDSEQYYERARGQEEELSLTERIELAERSVEAFPWRADSHALLSDLLYLRSRRQGGVGPSGGTAESRAIRQARRATELNAHRSEYYTRIGRLYEQRWLRHGRSDIADYEAALTAYLRAEDLFESKPDTALNVGRIHDLAGRYSLALGKYLSARNLSTEQYHIPRQFDEAEMEQINRRIEILAECITAHEEPPPLNFNEPRLLGLPDIIS